MEKLRCFMKKDLISVCTDGAHTLFVKGQEVRIGKISESTKKVMIIDSEDDVHKWIDMAEYHDYIEDRFV